MNPHTPGNWHLSKDNDGGFDITDTPRKVKGGTIARLIASVNKYMYNGSTIKYMEGNAHLIAATPDLLEACKFARECLDSVSAYSNVFEKLDKAIKKAEGVQ